MRHWFCCCLFVILACLPCAAQQGAGAPTPSDPVKAAQEALRAAEAAHPGNTEEVAKALDDLANAVMAVGTTDAGTLEIAKREMAVAEAADGPRSKLFVAALTTASGVMVQVNQSSEARVAAERAVEIAKSEFPNDVEFANANDALAYACQALGDKTCFLNAIDAAIAEERNAGATQEWDLMSSLSFRAGVRDLTDNSSGAGVDIEEALEIAHRLRPDSPETGILESNAATHYLHIQEFDKAIPHYQRSLEIIEKAYGPDAPMLQNIHGNLGEMYTRTGQFELAWQNFKIVLSNKHATIYDLAAYQAAYARSLAGGGELERAIEEGLKASRMGRENFVLQARTLPEEQAIKLDQHHPWGLNIALSVVAKHPDLVSEDIFQEVARNRALVTEEMARRERNLNANNDPEVAQLLKQMDAARADLLALEQQGKQSSDDEVAQVTSRMNEIERALAEHSSAVRDDDRAADVRIEDVRHGLPAHSVLISYVVYLRCAVESVDPERKGVPSYAALVLSSDSDRIRVYDLGEAKPIDDLVTAARASADREAHAGGLGSLRNERSYREAAANLRKHIWDPLRAELTDTEVALVVPDGLLNLIPFSALPDGDGYLVEHGPVIHMLTSERDLVPTEVAEKKKGLLAVGNPSFNLASLQVQSSTTLRGGEVSCDQFRNLEFPQLPGSAAEVQDIHAAWMRWNGVEAASLLTGDAATRAAFLSQAANHRVLHIATHAFLLDKSCGNGNPLLHSGLVFAGANKSRAASILTAQQIASLDLSGVDWAVLSACNTGNGELRDGEGVLGLERAFRVAGARNVVMTLWPVDDDVTRQFMHELYAQRLGKHAGFSDAAWNASRVLLRQRRAAHQSTHPWYWAGFVSSGAWK